MGVRDWFRRKDAAAASSESLYNTTSTDDLLTKAEKLEWQVTRTGRPGILVKVLTPAEDAMLSALYAGGNAEFMRESGSLRGAAYYAKKELEKRIRANPVYAEKLNRHTQAQAVEVEGLIKSAAALPGWQSNHNGGYYITTRDHDEGVEMSELDKDVLVSLGRRDPAAIEYTMRSRVEQYHTQDERLIGAIEALQKLNTAPPPTKNPTPPTGYQGR